MPEPVVRLTLQIDFEVLHPVAARNLENRLRAFVAEVTELYGPESVHAELSRPVPLIPAGQ